MKYVKYQFPINTCLSSYLNTDGKQTAEKALLIRFSFRLHSEGPANICGF